MPRYQGANVSTIDIDSLTWRLPSAKPPINADMTLVFNTSLQILSRSVLAFHRPLGFFSLKWWPLPALLPLLPLVVLLVLFVCAPASLPEGEGDGTV